MVVLGQSVENDDYGDNLGNFDEVTLVRYNADGSLDTTFGTGGIVTANLTVLRPEYADYPDFVFYPTLETLQADGKILVAGSAYSDYDNGNDDIVVIRFNSDGSVDTTFGTNGVVVTDLGANDYPIKLLAKTGKVIVYAGSSTYDPDNVYGYDYEEAIIRYDSNGTLDTTFGSGGRRNLCDAERGLYDRRRPPDRWQARDDRHRLSKPSIPIIITTRKPMRL
ncbi:MAG: delta-60 repeat domain-containing protein [Chthoniobacteraceae bacterium]